jgi:hypothetical protein
MFTTRMRFSPRAATPLDDGVAVALTLAEDGQHQGRGRRSEEVFAYLHNGQQEGIRSD